MSKEEFFMIFGEACFLWICIAIAILLICIEYKHQYLLKLIIKISEHWEPSEENDASLDWVDARKVRSLDEVRLHSRKSPRNTL